MSSLNNHLYRFEDFTVDAHQRVLLRAGKPVALTPKGFETLLILVESSGRIVEKEELKRRLWPDTFVEEANIAFNVQQLRKTLNDDARNPRYIGTVARRGYRFLAEVEIVPAAVAQSADLSSENTDGDAVVSAVTASKSPRNMYLTLVALLIVLAGAGFFAWKFFNRSSPGSESKLVAANSPSTSRIKVEQLTVTGQSYHLAISPDGKYVAYEREVEKKGGIWIRQLATNTNVELVPPTERIYGLAFAPNGEYLYYVKGEPTVMYRVPLLGGVATKILDAPQGNFSLSSSDNRIAFIRETTNAEGQREYSLFTANSDGTGERKLLTGTHPYGLDTPLWTPDGASIICSYGNSTGGSREFGLIEVNAADGQKKDLSSKKFFRITKMGWLPNGKGLLLSARMDLGDNNQLWRLTYPEMELTQLTEGLTSYADLSLTAHGDKAVASQETLSSEIWVGSSRDSRSLRKVTQAAGSFCWAPNGQIVYSSTASGNRDLWIMRPDGTEQRQLTTHPALDITPRVTPDNRYIVFVSNRTGAFQLWRMDLDGSNQIQLTSGGPKNHHTISADSEWVLYNTTDDWHLWKVSIDGGEPVQVAGYVATLPSLSPDQKTIVCVGRKGLKRELKFLSFAGGPPSQRMEVPITRSVGYRIKWTPDGKALIYMAEQNGPIAIVKQPLGGGPVEQLALFDQDELFDFDYSFDGQFLAVTRGLWQHDVVLISELGQ
jgi:DNA-binding winged helix-turn-helix (wHTH) protein/Tol biopolymer transport system component